MSILYVLPFAAMVLLGLWFAHRDDRRVDFSPWADALSALAPKSSVPTRLTNGRGSPAQNASVVGTESFASVPPLVLAGPARCSTSWPGRSGPVRTTKENP